MPREQREAIQAERVTLAQEHDAAVASVILTTEAAHNLPVRDRLDIITAEVALGMNLLKDVAAAVRNVVGGRSQVTQSALRDARKSALKELRTEAHSLGAQAVVGVTLNYSEIVDDGRVMLLLVAAGTAVTLSDRNESLA